MIGRVLHIGLTVSDMEQSIAFYRDILGLEFKGELMMEGKETDILFTEKNCKVRVAYLNGSDNIMAPPIELIQFVDEKIEKSRPQLKRISIAEVCFEVKDIDKVYNYFIEKGVECLSAPQEFDFSEEGFGKSKALYFRDPDGIILELMECL